MPRVFESIIVDKLTPLISRHILEEQHGFMPNRSTVTNLSIFCSYISSALESFVQTDVIYTDFPKAFDSVDHEILLNKLEAFGIVGNLLSWFRSYLSSRTQSVRVHDGFSRPIIVSSGVPQGSHLGPLLFSIFINDISSVFIDYNFLLFADDLKFFKTIGSPRDMENLQRVIARLESWCTTNSLRLNIGKCSVVRFCRGSDPLVYPYMLGGSILQTSHTVRDLGVTVDDSLKFSNHINNICSVAMKNLGLIKRFGL